ncbi:unnamed protein product [Danaus chrysippus]|uniref:(African queen) hypothetical protein n=1 Tax=Danaus chrysippus TaxID=151541 RepID=A0A8J2QDA3_9NEOP|nr:unnamed protein product [Danaus chrysippus]
MIVLLIILIIVIAIMAVGIYQKNTNSICRSKKRLDGKTVLVTGGTSGMGLRIAMDFADRGARVIIACPFVEEGTWAREKIVKKTENENVVFKLLDLSSCKLVRKFAEEINQEEERLDILINNAGMGSMNERLTKDGMNCTMQVNYYCQFMLTLLLLPLLKKTGTESEPARIVNTSSVLHNFGTTDFEMMNALNYWYFLQVYANSKLCIAIFTRELAKRLKGSNISVNVVDPGAVGTPIFLDLGKYYGAITIFLFLCLFKTPWQGAQTAIHVALDKRAGQVSGEFFKNCKLSQASANARSDLLAKELWKHTQKLIHMSDEEIDSCLHS